MLADLWNSMDGPSVFGLICLAVILYWLKRVEYPKAVLPPPVDKTVCDREMWAWMGRKS